MGEGLWWSRSLLSVVNISITRSESNYQHHMSLLVCIVSKITPPVKLYFSNHSNVSKSMQVNDICKLNIDRLCLFHMGLSCHS